MKEMILEELCRTAFDSMDNYFFLSEEDGEIRIKIKNPEKADLGNVQELSNGKNGFQCKLYSKERALARLWDYLGFRKEKTEEESEDLQVIRQMVASETGDAESGKGADSAE